MLVQIFIDFKPLCRLDIETPGRQFRKPIRVQMQQIAADIGAQVAVIQKAFFAGRVVVEPAGPFK